MTGVPLYLVGDTMAVADADCPRCHGGGGYFERLPDDSGRTIKMLVNGEWIAARAVECDCVRFAPANLISGEYSIAIGRDATCSSDQVSQQGDHASTDDQPGPEPEPGNPAP